MIGGDLMKNLRAFDHAKKFNRANPLKRRELEELISSGMLRPNGISVEVTQAGRTAIEEYARLYG